MILTGCAVHAVRGLDTSLFSCDQSYGNSRPQSRQTTYVPVTDAAAMLRRSLPRTVMGAAPFVPTAEDQIEQTHEPSSIEATPHAASRNFRLSPKAETVFGCSAAISVPAQVALSAPASPVPTASTKQEHNHDDNQNRSQAHIEVLRGKSRRSRCEQSVQKGTRAASSRIGAGETSLSEMQKHDAGHCALWPTRYRSCSFTFRWEYRHAWAAHPTGFLALNECASSPGISIAGSFGNYRLHLYVFLFPVWDDAEPGLEMVNSAQPTKVREITKGAAEAL